MGERKEMGEQIERLIKKYRIQLMDDGRLKINGMDPKKNKDDYGFIRENKPEFVSCIEEQKRKETEAYEARQAKIAAIEGLELLEQTATEWEQYYAEWNRLIENDGIGKTPNKPEFELDELKKKYPRAAAYMKAESWQLASHYAKATAGTHGLERIIEGEDYEQVLCDMEAEWDAHVKEHMWD